MSIHIEFNLSRKNVVDKADRVRGQKPKGMYQPHTSYTVRFPNWERERLYMYIYLYVLTVQNIGRQWVVRFCESRKRLPDNAPTFQARELIQHSVILIKIIVKLLK